MKKSRFVLCILLAALLLSFFGCKCKDGEHEYTENVIRQATCDKSGEVEYVCSLCGDTYREEIEKTEHDFKVGQTTDADCVTNGSTTYKCIKCGFSYKEETEIDKSAHKYDDGTDSVKVSCISDGTIVYKCILCGFEKTQTVPATGHDYASTVTAATCTSDGSETFVCSRCGDTYSYPIPATGHCWDEAGCIYPKTCRYCGLTEGSMLGHTVYGGVCERCGMTTDTTEIIWLTGVGNRIYDNNGGYAVVTNMYMKYEHIFQRGFSGNANLFFGLDVSNVKAKKLIWMNIYLTDLVTGKEYGPWRQGCMNNCTDGSFYVGYEPFAASPGLYALRLESLTQEEIVSYPGLWE